MNELERLRNEIDSIDAEIISCVKRRMDCAGAVARYKIENRLPVLDSGRERSVIESRIAMADDERLNADVRRLFLLLMSMSRARQSAILEEGKGERRATEDSGVKAAFQGEAGANSEAALVRFFGEGADALPKETFEDVFAAVSSGEARYGVLPIENSETGGIFEIYDFLLRYNVYIVGEVKLKIDHNLLGAPGAELGGVTGVYSHEQALMQCADYVKAMGMTPHPYYNTAVSAKYVSECGDASKAAIASAYAAGIYGLDVLDRDISAGSGNTTRFVVISKAPYEGEGADKASLWFVLDHKSGELARALNAFAAAGLNMAKIESRPLTGRNFEYSFYVDFEGDGVAERLCGMLKSMPGLFREYRFLGAYRKA